MQMDAFFKQHGYRVAPVTVDNGEWVRYANVMNAQADSPAREATLAQLRTACRTC